MGHGRDPVLERVPANRFTLVLGAVAAVVLAVAVGGNHITMDVAREFNLITSSD